LSFADANIMLVSNINNIFTKLFCIVAFLNITAGAELHSGSLHKSIYGFLEGNLVCAPANCCM